MKAWGAPLIGGACFCVSSAMAAPCVGDAFDQPFPQATDVAVRHLDIPSSQFPGFWQEGRVGGWPYRLFANGEGDLRSRDLNLTAWQISFTCQTGDEGCAETVVGSPPVDAAQLAATLQACLLGQESVAPDPVEPEAEQPSVDLAEAPQAEACGSALLTADTQEMALQKLLAQAGGDPGPADGILGPQTRQALVDVIGKAAATLEPAEAIATLDALLCD